MTLTQCDSKTWPVITAYCHVPMCHDGANPVHEGVGTDGPEIGYFSGGKGSPPDGPHNLRRTELWLRLDPEELRRMLADYDASTGNQGPS